MAHDSCAACSMVQLDIAGLRVLCIEPYKLGIGLLSCALRAMMSGVQVAYLVHREVLRLCQDLSGQFDLHMHIQLYFCCDGAGRWRPPGLGEYQTAIGTRTDT